jgi:hypothetical protein
VNVGLLAGGALAGIFGVGGLWLATKAAGDSVRLAGATDAPAAPGACLRLRGRVEATGEQVTAPLSGESCVGYVVAQERYVRRGGTPLRRWTGYKVARDLPRFSVTDGADRVDVRLDGYTGADARLVGFGGAEVPGSRYSDLRLDADERTGAFDPGESPPASVVETLALDASKTDERHRYAEWRVEAGDDPARRHRLWYVEPDVALSVAGDRDGDGRLHAALVSGHDRAAVAGILARRALAGGVLTLLAFAAAALLVVLAV